MTNEMLRLAYEQAARSPDPSNQNGAVLVTRDGRVVADHNRFPEGYAGDLADRDEKIFHIGHAEMDVVFAAARLGIPTEGATVYCPWFACRDCAKALIFSGVTMVVGHKQRMDTTPERWRAEVGKALKYLRDCAINVWFHDGPVGGPAINVNGSKWQP